MSTLTQFFGGGGGGGGINGITVDGTSSAANPAGLSFGFDESRNGFIMPYSGTVTVVAIGGGGAGGTTNYNATSTIVSGGGAGGTAIKTFDVTKGDSVSFTVGAGGTYVGTSSGNSGGTTTFTHNPSSTTLTTNGGVGGRRGALTTIAGGQGGTATGGDFNYTGGAGGDATCNTTNAKGASGGGGVGLFSTGGAGGAINVAAGLAASGGGGVFNAGGACTRNSGIGYSTSAGGVWYQPGSANSFTGNNQANGADTYSLNWGGVTNSRAPYSGMNPVSLFVSTNTYSTSTLATISSGSIRDRIGAADYISMAIAETVERTAIPWDAGSPPLTNSSAYYYSAGSSGGNTQRNASNGYYCAGGAGNIQNGTIAGNFGCSISFGGGGGAISTLNVMGGNANQLGGTCIGFGGGGGGIIHPSTTGPAEHHGGDGYVQITYNAVNV
jgi:hypothetical protein